MNKLLITLIGLLLAPLAWAQDNVYYPQVYTNGGQITASVTSTGACPSGSCIGITIPTTVTTITVGVLGTFSATIQPEESQNGGYTWTSAGAAITTSGTTVYTVTAFTNFRIRASAYVSGVANVNIQAGPTGGSSGSGTAGVTSLNGLAGAVTLAAGSNITLTPSGNTITIASTGGGGGSCPAGASGDVQFTNGTSCVNANSLSTGAVFNIDNTGTFNMFAGPTNLEGFTLGPGGAGIQATDPGATFSVETNGNTSITSDAGSVRVNGHTSVALESATTFTETVNSVLGLSDSGAGVTVGSPTGGAKGAGTLNATGLFVNGVAVGTGSGTVTSFSSGNLSPLFTTSVATSTTTPALTFAQVSQSANLVFASPNGSSGNPTFRALVAADLPAGPAGCPAGSANAVQKTNGTTCVASGITDNATTVSTSELVTLSGTAAAAVSPFLLNGTIFTGGSGTSTVPYAYLNFGASPTTFATTGTLLGINAPSGFTGSYVDIRANGGSGLLFVIGNTTINTSLAISSGAITSSGNITVGATTDLIFNGRSFLASPANGTIVAHSNAVGDNMFESSAFQSIGTKFTASGCSNSTTLGGASAGSFLSGTTGTCAVTITIGGSLAATNGWHCSFADHTTPANLLSQTGAASTTTASMTGTTVSGDLVSFSCEAY